MVQWKISRGQYGFIQGEVEKYQEEGIITQEQKGKILDLYQIKEGLSFIRVVLVTGAILVGLGVLSFIASNWDEMGKLLKYLIILVLYWSVNFAAYSLYEKYPKTGRSLVYLGDLVYGAGIFLVGQIFNFGGHFTSAFLLWALGAFPSALLFKDKIIYIFTCLLLMVYLNGSFGIGEWPWYALLAIPLLYVASPLMGSSPLITFFNNLVLINGIGVIAGKYELLGVFIALMFFTLGLIFQFWPLKKDKWVFRLQGDFLVGISGIFLTIPELWERWGFISNGTIYSIIFTLAFIIYLLILTKKESIMALIFLCFTIMRYYFDLTYDFMPKSLFFISGGLILLAFGFYIERRIKRTGGMKHVA